MYLWIIYDIANNKKRKKLADLCMQLGLMRVQKSVFLGYLPPAKLLKQFEKTIPNLINYQKDRLFLIKMNESEYQQMQKHGQKLPEDLHDLDSVFFF